MKRTDDSQDTLFSASNVAQSPLAQRMRPEDLDQLVGQTHFLNPGFRKLLETDRWSGFIFWGPPGTGKTTLANVIAKITRRPFVALSAVTSGVKDIREAMERSRAELGAGRLAHILFIDEVHRLNKAQQDVLLPFLEDGSVRFIGATTENPSFEINNAIASRSLIFRFNSLSQPELVAILRRAAKNSPEIEEGVLEKIAEVSIGDARRALTLLEHLTLTKGNSSKITEEDFKKLTHSQSLYYDKKSDAHYDTISAFIKSVRGSDPDAAVYYLARLLEAGEDPLFVARRLIILASEDIGNASPLGLVIATNAFHAVHAIGMPEARIILAQATTYLACAEKSNRSYVAIEEALEAVKQTGAAEIPYAIRNAPTKMMKEWGYGKDYRYAHNQEGGWAEMQFLPDILKDRRFYQPSGMGQEKKIQEFLEKRGKKNPR
jgi:putative ATPase